MWSCNIAIWRKFQQSSVASQQQNRAAQNKRLTKTLLFASFFALLCWLPLVIRNNLLAHHVRITQNIINLVSLIYYSNTIVNPIVYSLRIPELKQALALCCSRKQTEIIVKGKEGRIKMAAAMELAVSPATQLSLQDDASHELAFEQEIMDTKL